MASGSSYPSGAYILSLIGGILILISGLVTAILAGIVGSYALNVIPGAAVLVIVLGVIGLLIGIGVVYLATKLKSNPQRSAVSSNGLVILILAVVSLFVGGGGFYIGAILAIVGGVLAMVWKP